MKLFNASGDYLNLSIQGYQFPENNSCYYDSNWLIIVGKVKIGGKVWSFQDPCLLNFEALRLANWLDRIAEESLNKDDYPIFIEPNLDFEIIEANKVRIYFNLESRPKWAPSDEAGEDDLFLEFQPNKKMARLASEALRLQLQSYPIRALHDK